MVKRKNRKTNIKKAYGKKLRTNWGLIDHIPSTSNVTTHNVDGANHVDDDDEILNEEDIYTHALTSPEQFPEEMIKYWKQRRSLFNLFDGSSISGKLPLLDKESWYSITPEPIAARIAERCRSSTILDPFCGVGGNSIQFALTCENVISIDIDPIKIKMAKHNAKVYGVEKFITFLQGDWKEFANAWIRNKNNQQLQTDQNRWKGCQKLKFDVIFLSPPWGGVSYRTLKGDSSIQDFDKSFVDQDESFYPLSALAPSGGKDLYETAKQITPNICLYVPRTVDLNELTTLIDGQKSKNDQQSNLPLIDVEEQWLRGRCKALSCYFGELANWVEEES